MLIYDSKTNTKIEVQKSSKSIKIYVCGPTVYDDSHLGHARSAVVFDTLVRVLKVIGYNVLFVRNITDVDDKIIKKMDETGESLDVVTNRYYLRYKQELESLGCLSPDIEPKATESIEAMSELIQTLLNKGFAYTTPSGDIYFDADKDAQYLSLSKHNSEDTQSRIDGGEKKGGRDFVLWKSAKKEEAVSFDSPFGKGRPGWHTECSAMINKHLSSDDGEYEIDIHGGGSDLLFPHHENEAAQTRCAYGKKLAKIWMHNGFVTIGGEKMSKSLGNSFFLKDALSLYDGEIVRFYLLTTHYRANFNFSLEDLEASKKRLDKLYRLKKRVETTEYGEITAFKTAFLEALADDLNLSKALAIVDELVQQSNDVLDKNPKDNPLKAELNSIFRLIESALGIGGKNPFSYFQLGVDGQTKEIIEQKIVKRSESKKQKDFATADGIRDELKSIGIELMDTPNGTVWEKL